MAAIGIGLLLVNSELNSLSALIIVLKNKAKSASKPQKAKPTIDKKWVHF